MSADLKAAMQADYETWAARNSVVGGSGLLQRIWIGAYEAAWNRRAPLPAEQPSNPVPLMSRKVELELLAVAEACVAQGCIVAMEDWIEARIVGQQTNSKG